MLSLRAAAIAAVVLAAAASRLLPHLPNVTPIAAMALFGGARLADRRLAVLIPIAAMLLSDLVLGLHALAPVVYACMALIACIGFLVRDRRGALPVAAAALAGSVVFFLVTNGAVWALGSTYPKTPEGLAAAYAAGIPFFRNTVAGDLLYTAVLFGGLAVLERVVAAVRDGPRAVAGRP